MKKILLILFISCLFSQEITVNDTIAIQNKMLEEAKIELQKRYSDIEKEKENISYSWQIMNNMIIGNNAKIDSSIIKK